MPIISNRWSLQVNKFLNRLLPGLRCPVIRWDDVVRIEALGTDAISAFAVSLTFCYCDGTSTTVHPEHKGSFDLIEPLHDRFPSIPPDWYDQMSKQPWHVERVFHVRTVEQATP